MDILDHGDPRVDQDWRERLTPSVGMAPVMCFSPLKVEVGPTIHDEFFRVEGADSLQACRDILNASPSMQVCNAILSTPWPPERTV
jgi:hypothetical protein